MDPIQVLLKCAFDLCYLACNANSAGAPLNMPHLYRKPLILNSNQGWKKLKSSVISIITVVRGGCNQDEDPLC